MTLEALPMIITFQVGERIHVSRAEAQNHFQALFSGLKATVPSSWGTEHLLSHTFAVRLRMDGARRD